MKKPCRISGKVKYDSHEKAAVAAGEIITQTKPMFNKKHGRADALWTYKCDHCDKWHLTSKDPIEKP